MATRQIIAQIRNVGSTPITVYVGATAGTVVGGSGCGLYTYGNYINLGVNTLVLNPNEIETTYWVYDDSELNPTTNSSYTEYGIVKVYSDPYLQHCIAGSYGYNTFAPVMPPQYQNAYAQMNVTGFSWVGQTLYGTLYIQVSNGSSGTSFTYNVSGPQFSQSGIFSGQILQNQTGTIYGNGSGGTYNIQVPFSITFESQYDGYTYDQVEAYFYITYYTTANGQTSQVSTATVTLYLYYNTY